MGAPAVRSGVTPEEYLAFDRASETKHEYADGEVFAMAGASRAHSRLGMRIGMLLEVALEGRLCEAHGPDMRVKIAASGRYVYPDVTALCGRPIFDDQHGDVLTNPSVVVEVLSPSTALYDRGDKFAHYRGVPSIRDHVLVSQASRVIEHYRRDADGSWRATFAGPGERVELASIGVTLEVDRVYDGVTLSDPEEEPTPR